jgi:hypothetical protein
VNTATRTSSRNVFLMAFALRVREVAALTDVNGETQLTLVRAEVILHKIRILRENKRKPIDRI